MTTCKSSRSDMPQAMAALPLFQSLAPVQVERVAPFARERRMSRGQVVFHKGDQATGLFVVIKGHVKLALLSTAGNEKIVELVGPGQCFGEVALLTETAYPFFAQAVRDASLLFMPKEVVLNLLETAPAFARCLLLNLAGRTHMLLQDVETYTQHTSSMRVIAYLQRLCQDVDDQGDCVAITLPTSKQILASRLNLAPETLSRILHELSDARLIAVQGRNIQVTSRQRLHSYCPSVA
ncbi:MAG: Crp/Fnr family transcriptional regulator [Rhodocyclales bacterium]|nr:Crp/Fnr family transcriptional regulator [Rhodocyclales bacterium]